MEIGEALNTYLTSYSNLNTLIQGRFFPVTVPQDTPNPSITYMDISGDRTEAINHGDDSTGCFTIQFRIFADSYSSLKQVSTQLLAALRNYNGTMGGVGGVVITATRKPTDDIDDYNDTMQEYSTLQEYIFFFEK